MNGNLITQFNKWAGENRNLIQKALSGASGANGAALIPQHLEQIVTNAVPRISPELSILTPKYDPQSLHEFNQLVSLNNIGAAMGESSTTPTTQPTFARKSVQLKVLKKKGSTTDFLRWSSAKNIDAAAANVEATLTSLVHDMCNYVKYGNAGADPYEFSGWDSMITTNRIGNTRGGTAMSSLGVLDQMIDLNTELQGMDHHKVFIMSPRMLSRHSQLLTNVRLNQGLSGNFSQVNIPGGWRLNAYRDIPIIVSGSDRPRSTVAADTIGTVTPTGADAGGTIADSQMYYFVVAPITKDGEQLASAEVSRATGTGGSGNLHTVTLSWTANPNAYRYKIYVGSSTGTEVLKHIVPGFTYDANGTITGSTTTTVSGVKSWTSDANGNTQSVTFLSAPTTAGVEVPTALQSDVPYITSNSVEMENIWLIDVDEFQGMGRMPFTNQGGSQFNGLISMEMLAKTDSQLPFLLQSYCAIAPSFEATSVLYRGARVQ